MGSRNKKQAVQLALGGDLIEPSYKPGNIKQYFGAIRKRKFGDDKFQLTQTFDFSEPNQNKRREMVRATFSVEHLLNPKLNLGDILEAGDLSFHGDRSIVYYSYDLRDERRFVGLPWGTVIGKDSSSRLFGARLAFYHGSDELLLDIADWGLKIVNDYEIKNVMPEGTTEETGREGVVGDIKLISYKPDKGIIWSMRERLAELHDKRVSWDFRGWVYEREQSAGRIFGQK